MESDFTILPVFWNTVNLDKQFSDLRAQIEQLSPECVVILNVPRHHAKKVSQQDWTKDYFSSKQKSGNATNRVCTVVYSKYPYTSEEWISTDASVTHIAEVCVPIGSWKPHRSPIELLQEYGLTYDEVATITVAASNSDASVAALQLIFDVNKLKNTIAFVTNSGVAVDTVRWQRLVEDDPAIHLKSDIAFAGAAAAAGEATEN